MLFIHETDRLCNLITHRGRHVEPDTGAPFPAHQRARHLQWQRGSITTYAPVATTEATSFRSKVT